MTHATTLAFVNQKNYESTEMRGTGCLQATSGLLGITLMTVGSPYFHFVNLSNEDHTAFRVSIFVTGCFLMAGACLSFCINSRPQTNYEEIKEAAEDGTEGIAEDRSNYEEIKEAAEPIETVEV